MVIAGKGEINGCTSRRSTMGCTLDSLRVESSLIDLDGEIPNRAQGESQRERLSETTPMYIYLITNNLNGKVYVGQTQKSVAHRWMEHVWDSKRRSKTNHLYRAIQKHGKESFSCRTLNHAASPEDLSRLEQFYIKIFRSSERAFGYNLTTGGERGFNFTPATLAKIAAQSTGRRKTQEQIERIRAANKQRFLDNPALRVIYSERKMGSKNPAYGKHPWNYGLKATPEARRNQSLAHLGRRHGDATVRTHGKRNHESQTEMF